MAHFKKGDRVKHPVLGAGTVMEDENNGPLPVLFDGKGETMLALKYAMLEHLGEEKEINETRDWLATFCYEDGEALHYMGSHWDPFFAGGADEVMRRLPEFIRKARTITIYGNLLPAPRQHPSEWHKGFYLAWPDQQSGLMMALMIRPDANEVVSLFPFIQKGAQHSIVIERVMVWDGGLEAQIEATLPGGALITFFDIHFISNRAWYEAGKTYQFLLTGIAYYCRHAKNKPFVIDPPPKWVREVRQGKKFAPWAEQEPDAPMELRIDGMAALLSIEEWDKDNYSFHGPITEITEIEILEQPAWLLRVTVLRSLADDSDIDLLILVTRRAWQAENPPAIDVDVEGRLWLQGELWHPGEPEEEKW